MALTENFIRDAIQLDSGAEVMYGSDQIYDTYPCRFQDRPDRIQH